MNINETESELHLGIHRDTWTENPNFQNICQNYDLKLSIDSFDQLCVNDTIYTRFCQVVLQKSLAFKDHFRRLLETATTQVSSEKKNRVVRKCNRLVLHVRVMFPKLCRVRRSVRVLPRCIKIVGARLSNQPM